MPSGCVAAPTPMRVNDRAASEAEQLRGRLDRVVRDPERAREDIGGTTRQRGERGVRADQAVCGLVERPVAGEHDDDVDAHLRRLTRELGRVAALPGLDDFDVVLGRERLGHRSRVRASLPTKRSG